MEIEKLRQLISDANKAYWLNHESIMSDTQYDAYVSELKSKCPNDPLVSFIGGVKGSCQHPYPMLSLDKAYSKDEILNWMNKVKRSIDEKFYVSPKLDGCTCRITDYNMFTRGDGYSGEDITKVIPITNFKVWKDGRNDLGEMIITNSDFNNLCLSGEYTKQDGTVYQNSRNAVAGILGRKDVNPNDPKVLTFVSYDAVQFPVSITKVMNEWDQLIEHMNTVFKDYPTDGLVFKLADKEYADSLGNTDHHPRGAIAYKFQNESARTKITNIIWSPGKEYITPVATVEPININGSNITQVTLHNWRNVHVNDIQIGDIVTIERAGDVIPKVVHVESGEKRMMYNEPSHCEFCGRELKHTDVELYCTNEYCKGKILQKLESACKTFGLDGFGPAVLNELYDKCIVRDLLDLVDFVNKVKCMPCDLGPGIISNLCDQINAWLAKGVKEEDLLTALCIPTIGSVTAKAVVQSVSLIRLITEPSAINDVKITPAKFKELKKFLTKDKRAWLFVLYCKCNMKTNTSNSVIRKICFTGTMSKPRKELEADAELKGFTSVNQVTRDLDILVVPDMTHQSTKVSNAKKFGIRIITEQEFYEIK